MHKILSIIHYEYKMLIKKIATWVIFLVASVIALLDNFPSANNFARLEFLNQPAYFIYRIISLDAIIIVFGIIFLLSQSIPIDSKTGVKELIMTSPVCKSQYILGKMLGGFFYTFSLLCIFLTFNTLVYYIAAPFQLGIVEYIVPYAKTIFVSIIPISIFISFCSITIPALIDIRGFYLLMSVIFFLNVSNIATADISPFYLITSGDLIRLVWVHPEWSKLNIGSMITNLIFLLGCGLISWCLLLLNKNFWRIK